MHPFVMGHSSAVLTAMILFSVLAFNRLKKKKRAPTPSFISPTPIGQGNDHYDVFLSFRGSDTRKGFADHLYHNLDKAGIVPVFVFRDDKSIPIGEEFGPQILDAITWSKISIPIISKNYASSKWCLRELIHIMDCAKSMSHIVLPIFYKVDPSDVRHLKGSFGKAFHSRKKYFDEEDIQKGQQALKEVSYLHGWESEKVANGHEGELVKKVTENVLSKLRQDFQLDFTNHLVGIGDHVNKIMKWVDAPTTNVRMIGIYGMDGIGKTTLAKASKQLKVLEVSYLGLRRTPDLSAFTQLKILKLNRCEGLDHLHPSIGKLTNIISLDWTFCRSLKELPEKVGELKNLEELFLDHSGITEIPQSIASLKKLKELSANYCKSLRKIPTSIGDLQNLRHLDLSHSGIENLPSAIGRLKNLRTLRLGSCHSLKGGIPSEISDLPSLEDLDISWTPISDLPECVQNLSFSPKP